MNINEIIASNLIKLRKKNQLTQIELSDIINYSDKSISKWETGEATPNITVLKKLADYYGITLDELVDENLETEARVKPKHNYSHLVITLLACSVVWLIATTVFIYGTLFELYQSWAAFLYAVPITCIVILVFNTLWGNKRKNYLIISILTWSFLLVVYLIYIQYNVWVIFFLGIPVQVILILWSKLKKNHKNLS